MISWISMGLLIPMLLFIYAIGEQAPKFISIVGWILLPLSVVLLAVCGAVASGDRTVSKDWWSFPARTHPVRPCRVLCLSRLREPVRQRRTIGFRPPPNHRRSTQG